MIIKNNFNEKSANPLEDYSSVGRTHDLENEIEKERKGLAKTNLENSILNSLNGNKEEDNDDNRSEDPWKFFK